MKKFFKRNRELATSLIISVILLIIYYFCSLSNFIHSIDNFTWQAFFVLSDILILILCFVEKSIVDNKKNTPRIARLHKGGYLDVFSNMIITTILICAFSLNTGFLISQSNLSLFVINIKFICFVFSFVIFVRCSKIFLNIIKDERWI